MNYRVIATQVGNLLKWDSTANEIDRAALARFRFRRESFPNEAITSIRAQRIYDWVLSLAKQPMDSNARMRLLADFCLDAAPDHLKESVLQALLDNGLPENVVFREEITLFYNRSFHREIVLHCKKLFLERNYFHAVFEAVKVYNKLVKDKACSSKDGQSLMMDVWGSSSGVLKVTPCVTETDRNVQDGIKFLSSGLMQAIRNPTAHEPAVNWPIDKEDCLDILSFVSFLLRRLDEAIYYAG
jgi:uncharacterized protein (TIGR02391 family)